MKSIYASLFLCLAGFQSNAQQIHCRPRICMIDYFYHDDNSSNAQYYAQKSAILAANPDILVTCTPNSYWGRRNGTTGTIPSFYTPFGTKVYSYIAGGYEGTSHGNEIDNLDSNLSRIDGIWADGATGVYLDEVSHHPGAAGKNYLNAIYNRCRMHGLKLIFNPGTMDFDTSLMSKCDYILTDEGYNGTRTPSSSELPFLNRVIVIADSVNNANDAATISLGARANGFGYSYACKEYITLPSWLSSYLSMITQSPAAPVITSTGSSLHSSAPYGNQWYMSPGSLVNGAIGQNYTPTTTGIYYSIVTMVSLTRCSVCLVNALATCSSFFLPACVS